MEKKDFFRYLLNDSIELDQVRYYKVLLRLYNKLNNYTNYSVDSKEILNKLEDKIYTVNGIILSDKKRILYELNEIKKRLKDSEYFSEQTYFKIIDMIDYVNKLVVEKDWDKNKNITYRIKKIIVKIEILLNMDVKFYSIVLDIFEEENNNLKIKYLNNIDETLKDETEIDFKDMIIKKNYYKDIELINNKRFKDVEF